MRVVLNSTFSSLRWRNHPCVANLCKRRQVSFGHRHRPSHFSIRATAKPDSIYSYCDQECSLEGWRRPLGSANAPAPPMIALGKFDALHRGHQALAIAASQLGGHPWLVCFSGMAEILQWPTRLPLVALCDRKRVMHSWKDSCDGKIPSECAIPFSEVRCLSPEEFVQVLAHDLCIGGVAVGSNYRFGYKAAGDAAMLQSLGTKYGLKVSVVDLVEHEGELFKGEVISSSWVREALAEGDVEAAAFCLGRPYRLVVTVNIDHENDDDAEKETRETLCRRKRFTYENQPPAHGRYNALLSIVRQDEDVPGVECGIPGIVEISEQGLDVIEPAGLIEEAVQVIDRHMVLVFDLLKIHR